MSTSRAATAALLLILVTSTSALAGWGSKGNHEPDLAREIGEKWIWPQPDWTPAAPGVPARVYLNGAFGQCVSICFAEYGSLNPNVAAVRSGAYGVHMDAFAFFGVWRDCNKDSYIGFAEFGLVEYRADLLLDSVVCPRVSTPNPIPLDWYPSHNDGQWVREYLPFAHNTPGLVAKDANPWNINDNEARAWTDPGEPETQVVLSTACRVAAQPRGAWHSTGGMIRYLGCHDKYAATDAFNDATRDAGAPELGFSDSPREHDKSASPLNQPMPWGEPGDESYVEAWDCSQGNLAHVPIDGRGRNVNVSWPSTSPSVSANGRPLGTINSTASGLDECERTTANHGSTWIGAWIGLLVPNGHFHIGQFLATAPYMMEADYVPPAAKTGTSDMRPSSALFMSNRPASPTYLALGPATPPDLGARVFFADGLWVGGGATGDNAVYDTAGDRVNGPRYQTFYAQVGSAAIAKYGLVFPNGATVGTYGSEACGTATSGYRNGWDCDKAHWGSSAKPGAAYRLRDIDCYDQSVAPLREQGVGWGLVTDTQCASHVSAWLPGP